MWNGSTPAYPPRHTWPDEEIKRFFAGFDLVDSGLGYLPLWHPDSHGAAGHGEQACVLREYRSAPGPAAVSGS
jgi:hypothetical protein